MPKRRWLAGLIAAHALRARRGSDETCWRMANSEKLSFLQRRTHEFWNGAFLRASAMDHHSRNNFTQAYASVLFVSVGKVNICVNAAVWLIRETNEASGKQTTTVLVC